MPYIRMGRAELLPLAKWAAEGPGDLNYQITSLIVQYLENHGVSYATFNEVIGVLECAKLELYRRKVAEYEDFAKERNGDVY